ncbi:MAG TPA: hypothetical protein VLN48_18295 [Bryobacteraceae bacterium]|nr:hypothetical protein [Bryobacteraceae bacterium]
MDNQSFESRDLRVRISENVAYIDQRTLDGDPWREIDKNDLPMPALWLATPRTSPLQVALRAFELEHPGDSSLRLALGV